MIWFDYWFLIRKSSYQHFWFTIDAQIGMKILKKVDFIAGAENGHKRHSWDYKHR